MRTSRAKILSGIRERISFHKLTFNKDHISRLKELHPTAKYFFYIPLPGGKEDSSIVESGANLKKSIKSHLSYLKETHNYTDSELSKIETYDLRSK